MTAHPTYKDDGALDAPPPPIGETDPAAAEAPAAMLPQADDAAVPVPRLRPERPAPEIGNVRRDVAAATPPRAASADGQRQSGGAGGGGRSEEAGRAAVSSYQATVAAQLRRFRFYPTEARRQALTGTAIVAFAIGREGGVGSVRVVRSAGSDVLDRAAVDMVRRASPFASIPPAIGAPMTIQAPIAFELPR